MIDTPLETPPIAPPPAEPTPGPARKLFAAVMLSIVVGTLGFLGFEIVSQAHLFGGSWSYSKCVDAREQGASRDLLIEHGCRLNMFSGSVMKDGE